MADTAYLCGSGNNNGRDKEFQAVYCDGNACSNCRAELLYYEKDRAFQAGGRGADPKRIPQVKKFNHIA